MRRFDPTPSSAQRDIQMPADALWLSESGLRAGAILLVDHQAPLGGIAQLEAKLAVAFSRRLPDHLFNSIVKSIEVSAKGDHALANLRLAILGLPRIPAARSWPARMAMADKVLSNGISADELLLFLGEDDPGEDGLIKSNPDQPRVPAGSGRASGQWTSDGSTSSTKVAFAPNAAPLLAPSLTAETLAALSTFAATVGFAATLGTLFVPSPNSTSSSGPLPGDTENTYSYDHDEGLIRVLGPSGVVLAAGHKDGSGVFFDENTGFPFARVVDGALVFDGDSIRAVTAHAEPAAAVAEKEDEDDEDKQPKLCPDAGPDQPGSISAKPRARAYQEQISFMTNPQRPLPFGLAMNLINPFTGSIVHYDECDEMSGTMIEAKGPGFDGLLSFPSGFASVTKDWLDQGRRELDAAGARQVVWYFAEDYAAAYARALFAGRGLGKIVVKVQHPW